MLVESFACERGTLSDWKLCSKKKKDAASTHSHHEHDGFHHEEQRCRQQHGVDVSVDAVVEANLFFSRSDSVQSSPIDMPKVVRSVTAQNISA